MMKIDKALLYLQNSPKKQRILTQDNKVDWKRDRIKTWSLNLTLRLENAKIKTKQILAKLQTLISNRNNVLIFVQFNFISSTFSDSKWKSS